MAVPITCCATNVYMTLTVLGLGARCSRDEGGIGVLTLRAVTEVQRGRPLVREPSERDWSPWLLAPRAFVLLCAPASLY